MRPITPHIKTLEQVAHFLDIQSEVPALEIHGISSNSQEIIPGDLFIATAGATSTSAHGARYAEMAVKAGAVAILTDSKQGVSELGVPVITSPALSLVLGDLCSWFYGHPSRSMYTVGITGTNGKTTTSSTLYQLWKLADRSAASLGTLGTVINDEDFVHYFLNDNPVEPPTTPPRIKDAHHVSKEIGILSTGNSVFNDQIVATGARINIATIAITPKIILPILFLLNDCFIQIFKLFMLRYFL
jgi:UDP-N-acetylmuramyl tripeptide synthase